MKGGNDMKKTIILLLASILALSLLACGTSSDTINDKLPAEQSQEEISTQPNDVLEPTEETFDLSIERQIIYEKDNIRITVTGLDNDDLFGPAINVLVENNSGRNITVQAWNCSVNGLMVEAMFSCDVAAGKKANDAISFFSSDLETAHITMMQHIDFSVHIFDSDSWEDIDNSEIITLTTNADPAYIQEFDDSGFVAYDAEGIKIVVQKLNSSDSFWGSDLYVYVENNTDANITIQSSDVSINGFMVEPAFSCDITAGNKAYDTITFFESDLEDNGITDISEMDIKFVAFDSDSWNDILETDIVTIEFN